MPTIEFSHNVNYANIRQTDSFGVRPTLSDRQFALIACKVGVIKAVRNSLETSAEVTALWVTHRLEELEYADGAIYMEDGKVVMHGDAATIKSFIEARQSAYIKQINS